MSYLALARKWRPTQFNQVVGQRHVLTALENALAQNRLHHAYLLSGTRGVGKTTIGRLFAKGLNCETGITAQPCGQCSTCQEIDQGRFVDLLEIDAASRTKVEDTRDLLDNVQYKPARGRFKVYLIDEVHMLSRHSFNALLKTLEEPPEYVKFILATTDPQKLPVTILSRCLQFDLKPIESEEIQQQLTYILGQEQVESETRALSLLAHAADGSMRDALSLTDQAIALGNGRVMTDSVTYMLGTLDTDHALRLLAAIGTQQPQEAMDCVSFLAKNGVDWDGLLDQLATQLHRIAMCQVLPESLDPQHADAEKVRQLSQALDPQDVQLYYQMALKGRRDLPLAPSQRIEVEMVVLRMIAFRPAKISPLNVIAPQTQPVSPNTSSENVSAVQPAVAADPSPSIPSSQTVDESKQAIHAQPPSVSEPTPAPPVEDVKPVKASGLRHQLRSQRKGLSSNQGGETKKTEATSVKSVSVLERLAQKHDTLAPVSPAQSDVEVLPATEKDEPYQWKPSRIIATEEKVNPITPSLLKKALEHEKTPEMTAKLLEESLVLCPWSQVISQLSTAKMTEQLALNSAFEQQGSTILLTLRPSQAHLNTDRAQSELLAELNRVMKQDSQLSVEVGDRGETPLELREKLYQARLENAFASLANDANIQFIEQRFAAELDRESVRPI